MSDLFLTDIKDGMNEVPNIFLVHELVVVVVFIARRSTYPDVRNMTTFMRKVLILFAVTWRYDNQGVQFAREGYVLKRGLIRFLKYYGGIHS